MYNKLIAGNGLIEFMRRLDLILVDQDKVSSRNRAQRLISEGKVRVRLSNDWEVPVKAGQKYPDWVDIDICQAVWNLV